MLSYTLLAVGIIQVISSSSVTLGAGGHALVGLVDHRTARVGDLVVVLVSFPVIITVAPRAM